MDVHVFLLYALQTSGKRSLLKTLNSTESHRDVTVPTEMLSPAIPFPAIFEAIYILPILLYYCTFKNHSLMLDCFPILPFSPQNKFITTSLISPGCRVYRVWKIPLATEGFRWLPIRVRCSPMPSHGHTAASRVTACSFCPTERNLQHIPFLGSEKVFELQWQEQFHPLILMPQRNDQA